MATDPAKTINQKFALQPYVMPSLGSLSEEETVIETHMLHRPVPRRRGNQMLYVNVAELTVRRPQLELLRQAPEVPEKKRHRTAAVLCALALLCAAGGGAVLAGARGKVASDSAQVDGHMINVSPHLTGQAARVLVRDNQQVNEGDVLVELDQGEFQARLRGAQAELLSAQAGLQAAQAQLDLTRTNVAAGLKQARGGVAQAQAGLDSAQAGIPQAQADVHDALSRSDQAESELLRAQKLYSRGATTQADLVTRQTAVEKARAALDLATARLTSAQAATDNWAGTIESAEGRLHAAHTGPQQIAAAEAAVAAARARVQQAEAGLQKAQLDLSHASIRAPARGLVTRLAVAAGQPVAPERPLLLLVALNDEVWVNASFREDQLSALSPGRPVEVRIKAFPGRTFRGHIDSMAGAPVAQRIPVQVRLDQHDGSRLLPGMSATVQAL